MFPYKIRKPAWGSLKPRGGGATCGAAAAAVGGVVVGDHDDPRADGGNLQLAILSDLIELRERYRDRLLLAVVPPPSSGGPPSPSPAGAATTIAAAPPPVSPARNRGRRRRAPPPPVRNGGGIATTGDDGGGGSDGPRRLRRVGGDHVPLGSPFADFKACFREARVGAMHTRTIPPRADRGEYAQLLYSCCLHLLERSSFGDVRAAAAADADPATPPAADDGGGGGARPPRGGLFDAAFSAFALYALHRTSVLPAAPYRRTRARRTPSGKFDERSLGESWSMLPIGINSDEDKLYRRTFLSPVRIDRRGYALLLRLRESCLARAERCGVDAIAANADGLGGEFGCGDGPPRRCYCGLARDAAHVVDAMLSDDSFFDYCEYHGPHGLEGLAGSPNFYGAHFADAPKRKPNGPPENDFATATAAAPPVMTKFDLKAIGNGDGILDSLDLKNLSEILESHCSNLNSIVTKLRMSRSTDGLLGPRQRELVENTLCGIASRPAYVELVDELNPEKALSAHPADVPGAISEAEPPPEAQPAGTKQVLLLKFPKNFSPFGNIDFTDEFMMIKKAVAKENRARTKGGSISVDADMNMMHPELACFDCSVPTETQLNERSMDDDDPPSTAVQRRTKRSRELDAFFQLQQEGIRDDGTSNNELDEVSIATGQGKNALLSLLSMSKGNESEDVPTDIFAQDDDFSIATGAGKNALLSLLSMAGGAYDSDHLEDESPDMSSRSEDDESDPRSSSLNRATQLTLNEDASVTSGIGKRALQFLLTGQAEDRRVKSRPKKKAPNQKSRSRVSKVNAQQKSVKKKLLPPLPAVKANQPKAVYEKRLEDGIFAEDDEDASSCGEFSVAMEDAGRNALAALLSNTETVEV
jgi:hypothetical protein